MEDGIIAVWEALAVTGTVSGVETIFTVGQVNVYWIEFKVLFTQCFVYDTFKKFFCLKIFILNYSICLNRYACVYLNSFFVLYFIQLFY